MGKAIALWVIWENKVYRTLGKKGDRALSSLHKCRQTDLRKLK